MIPSSIIIASVTYFFAGWIGFLISFGLSLIGFNIQRIMSPDLDVDNGFYGFFLIRKRFGTIISIFYEAYWKLYALIIPHRSWISHSPFLSTIIRFLYLFVPIILLFLFFDTNLLYYWDWFLYIYIGMAIADGGHIILDYIPWFRRWYESGT